MPKIQIVAGDLLLLAISNLGGKANNQLIYREAEKLWRNTGRPIPKNFESEVRAALQYHSLESKRQPKGEILFRMMKERGQGWWALVESKPLSELLD
jgi:hypothetical protein